MTTGDSVMDAERLREALREAVRLTPSSSRGRDKRPYADRLFDRLLAALTSKAVALGDGAGTPAETPGSEDV